jgi:DNA-binding transcriptional MerR regulator/methylmalonyl-CoA mutase cobalamin-binding subunit
MADEAIDGLFHIGGLAQRVGVTVETLRAWERRYELLDPQRSAGGFRLYSPRDEAIVRAMLAEIERGFPPAQAARLALAGVNRSDAVPGPEDAAESGRLAAARAQLIAALTAFEDRRAHVVIDRLLAEFTLDTVLEEVMLPIVRQIGKGWERGEVTVAQEHFASNVIRERLLGLDRPWDQGSGPRAVLACPPDERHDIGLVSFGIVLRRGGWRITFLGADTPVQTASETAAALRAQLVVLASVMDRRLEAAAPALRDLAATTQVAIAGRTATEDLARSTGTLLLAGAPVTAAQRLAAAGVAGLRHPDTTRAGRKIQRVTKGRTPL